MKIFDFQFCVLFIKLYIYKIANQIFKTFMNFVVFFYLSKFVTYQIKKIYFFWHKVFSPFKNFF
ncbi:MAG TPA: hypothetical protein DIS75_09900 [Chryseobacterium sp.]|nr:hypothetical protein [Chryseobacterium sp.]